MALLSVARLRIRLCHTPQVMNRDDDETRIEIAALMRVQPHPHIIAVLANPEYSVDSAFLVLEFADTDLLEVIMATGHGLQEEAAARYFIQVRLRVHAVRRRGSHRSGGVIDGAGAAWLIRLAPLVARHHTLKLRSCSRP